MSLVIGPDRSLRQWRAKGLGQRSLTIEGFVARAVAIIARTALPRRPPLNGTEQQLCPYRIWSMEIRAETHHHPDEPGILGIGRHNTNKAAADPILVEAIDDQRASIARGDR